MTISEWFFGVQVGDASLNSIGGAVDWIGEDLTNKPNWPPEFTKKVIEFYEDNWVPTIITNPAQADEQLDTVGEVYTDWAIEAADRLPAISYTLGYTDLDDNDISGVVLNPSIDEYVEVMFIMSESADKVEATESGTDLGSVLQDTADKTGEDLAEAAKPDNWPWWVWLGLGGIGYLVWRDTTR